MSASVLRCEDLHKTFAGGHEAVRGVSFSIREGEIFGLVGPNGAGKTTVVRMLTTLLRPSAGSATIAGHDLATEAAAIRRVIGIAMQDTALSSLLTAHEHLVMSARLSGLTLADARRRAAELLEVLGLEASAKRQIRTLSAGTRRRLDLACALVHSPRVLFLDEPTTGVDPRARMAVWNELRRLRDTGIAVLLTTHYLDEADRLCDRVAIIDLGRIVANGPPTGLKSRLAGTIVVRIGQTDHRRAGRILAPLGPLATGGADELVLEASANPAAVLQVLEHLQDAGVEPLGISVSPPSLDAVFLHATGTDLREREAGEA